MKLHLFLSMVAGVGAAPVWSAYRPVQSEYTALPAVYSAGNAIYGYRFNIANVPLSEKYLTACQKMVAGAVHDGKYSLTKPLGITAADALCHLIPQNVADVKKIGMLTSVGVERSAYAAGLFTEAQLQSAVDKQAEDAAMTKEVLGTALKTAAAGVDKLKDLAATPVTLVEAAGPTKSISFMTTWDNPNANLQHCPGDTKGPHAADATTMKKMSTVFATRLNTDTAMDLAGKYNLWSCSATCTKAADRSHYFVACALTFRAKSLKLHAASAEKEPNAALVTALGTLFTATKMGVGLKAGATPATFGVNFGDAATQGTLKWTDGPHGAGAASNFASRKSATSVARSAFVEATFPLNPTDGVLKTSTAGKDSVHMLNVDIAFGTNPNSACTDSLLEGFVGVALKEYADWQLLGSAAPVATVKVDAPCANKKKDCKFLVAFKVAGGFSNRFRIEKMLNDITAPEMNSLIVTTSTVENAADREIMQQCGSAILGSKSIGISPATDAWPATTVPTPAAYDGIEAVKVKGSFALKVADAAKAKAYGSTVKMAKKGVLAALTSLVPTSADCAVTWADKHITLAATDITAGTATTTKAPKTRRSLATADLLKVTFSVEVPKAEIKAAGAKEADKVTNIEKCMKKIFDGVKDTAGKAAAVKTVVQAMTMEAFHLHRVEATAATKTKLGSDWVPAYGNIDPADASAHVSVSYAGLKSKEPKSKSNTSFGYRAAFAGIVSMLLLSVA